jgi:PDZ domain-containing protein
LPSYALATMAVEALHMDRSHPYRPRVSRETRLLLTTGLIAIVALWVLARVRFPDRPPPQNPVQPLLTQLTPRPTFADLASEIAALRPRVAPLLVAGPAGKSGLRVREDVAAVWLDPKQHEAARNAGSLLRHDPASGLSLVQIESQPSQTPVLWSPEPVGPRYFIASEVSRAGLSLRPVYVGWLAPADSPRWPGQEWQLPSTSDLASGSFLFTADAAVAGLVVDHGDGQVLVPAATVLAEADRLLDRLPTMRAYVGIEVQRITASISKAIGATSGLIVTWVDPRGPAAGALHPGEVIEAVNGGAISTTDDWDVQTARLGADQTLVIGVRDSSGRRDVPVVGSAMPATDPASLGLTLRPLPGIGAEVVRVDPGSAGDRSGLLAGDVISRVDSTDAPTPAQVRQAFASPRERPLFIAFTRGTTHQVTALDRPTAKPEPLK